MGVRASSLLGPARPPPHGRGGLLRFGTSEAPPPDGQGHLLPFGTTEAPGTWVRGPPPLWDHRGLRQMGAGASFTFETT